MHYLYFVLCPKDKSIKTAEKAISVATEFLDTENFASEGNMFSSPKSDWYQVGGRWSGLLSKLTWAKETMEKIGELEKENGIQLLGCGYGDKEKTKKQKELLREAEEIWAKDRPEKYKNVIYNRTMYNYQEDDAMELTAKLIKALKKNWRDVEVCGMENYEEMLLENLTEKEIGQWIVVIDYHN